MPSNRPELDSELKKEMVRDSARVVFLEKGYEKASISQIAKQANVTVNTIYWYFSDKDELFAAVTEEMIQTFLDILAVRNESYSLVDNLNWVVDTLDIARPFIITVHERSARSEVIADIHQKFHTSLEKLLKKALINSGVFEEKIAPFVSITSFVVEGLLMHKLSKKEKRAIISQLLELCSLKT